MAMQSYFAIQGQNKYQHGLMGCLAWSAQQIKLDPTPIKILKTRAGEPNATVIAEVTPESIRFITGGRTISTRALRDDKKA